MGRREDGREEKDGGGKEESKGKSSCAPPETKSWLRHCTVCSAVSYLNEIIYNPATDKHLHCTVHNSNTPSITAWELIQINYIKCKHNVHNGTPDNATKLPSISHNFRQHCRPNNASDVTSNHCKVSNYTNQKYSHLIYMHICKTSSQNLWVFQIAKNYATKTVHTKVYRI